MPIFQLTDKISFPPVHLASRSGILAIGGDLTAARIIEAYSRGIFPWYADGEPILWWAPDPRFVLFPDQIKVSRSMRQFMAKGTLRVTYDRAFQEVIEACREPRTHQDGTWITPEMIEAYGDLHRKGIAHSVDVWQADRLVGGLYGVSLGGSFFGESMFSRASNASKVALIDLARRLRGLDFDLIDCQVYTAHLESLGAGPMPRGDFQRHLAGSLKKKTLVGNWGEIPAFADGIMGRRASPPNQKETAPGD